MATLADTQAIAVATGRKPATIRSWAHRGLLARHGTGPHKRALYDIGEAQELAARLDAVGNTLTMCNTEAPARAVSPSSLPQPLSPRKRS
jgi:hypothetical protein